jgi:hypothetical protein
MLARVATFTAISATGKTLERLLNACFAVDRPHPTKTVKAALVKTDDFDTANGSSVIQQKAPLLSIFLYRVEIDPVMRSSYAAIGSLDGRAHLPLDLHYLLSAWAEAAEFEHDILGSAMTGEALRSMKAPGTANNFDQQPAKMSDYVHLPADNNPSNDNGGVHINSGIPNRAFFLAATAIGGHAWEKAGKVWFRALTERLKPDSDFRAAADATVALAAEMFSAGGAEHNAIQAAWHQVGVL